MINHIFDLISLIKQKLYCNINIYIFKNNYNYTLTLIPKIKITYKIINNSNEIIKYINNNKIKNFFFKIKNFIDNGCKLYLVFANNDIVGFYMICELDTFRPYMFLKNKIFAGTHKNYIFFCHTFKEYRRMDVYAYMLTEICKKEASKEILITTDINNIYSIKGIQKAGFDMIGQLKYVEIKYLFIKENLNYLK